MLFFNTKLINFVFKCVIMVSVSNSAKQKLLSLMSENENNNTFVRWESNQVAAQGCLMT